MGMTNVERYLVGQGSHTKSFAGFLNAVRKRDERTLEKEYATGYTTARTNGVVKSAMGEESGSAGGYLVPVDYTLAIMDAISEESFIYPRATVIPMASAEMYAPKINADNLSASAGVSNLFGGLQFKWGSSQAPQETEPSYGQLSLKAWDLLGYAVVSNQWLEDISNPAYVVAGDKYLVGLLGKAAAWYAEYAFLQGTGAGQLMPLGILNAPATLSATRAGGNAIATIDIAKMASYLLPRSWMHAIWACSPTCLLKIMQLSTYQLNIGNEHPGAAGMLATRPLYVTDKLPALGSTGDLVLFDPTMYIIGNRMEVIVDVSDTPGFITRQTDFRVWLRLDGKPMLSDSITLADASTVVSPYVKLV